MLGQHLNIIQMSSIKIENQMIHSQKQQEQAVLKQQKNIIDDQILKMEIIDQIEEMKTLFRAGKIMKLNKLLVNVDVRKIDSSLKSNLVK